MKLKIALNEIKDYNKLPAKELMKFVIEFEKDEKGKTNLLLSSYRKDDSGTDDDISTTFHDAKAIYRKLIDIVTDYYGDAGGKGRKYTIDKHSFNAFAGSLDKAVQNYNDINVAMNTPSTGGMWDVRFYITEYLPQSGGATIRISGVKFSQGEEKEVRKKKRLFSK